MMHRINMVATRLFPGFFVDSKKPQRQLAAAEILLVEYNCLTRLINKLEENIQPLKLELSELERWVGTNFLKISYDKFSEKRIKAWGMKVDIERLEAQAHKLFSRKYQIRTLLCPQEKAISKLDPALGQRVARLIGLNPGVNIFV